MPRMSEKAVIEQADQTVLPGGRKFIAMGPHCYGYGDSAAAAVKNAKKNRVKIYEGKRGWCFILFDADHETHVDDMGSMSYVPKEGVVPYREIARFNMEVTNG